MAGSAIPELMKHSVPVGLLHLSVNVEARVALHFTCKQIAVDTATVDEIRWGEQAAQFCQSPGHILHMFICRVINMSWLRRLHVGGERMCACGVCVCACIDTCSHTCVCR